MSQIVLASPVEDRNPAHPLLTLPRLSEKFSAHAHTYSFVGN
jgi:hypothetical protein